MSDVFSEVKKLDYVEDEVSNTKLATLFFNATSCERVTKVAVKDFSNLKSFAMEVVGIIG